MSVVLQLSSASHDTNLFCCLSLFPTQGADQARAWHAKQVADALTAKLDTERQLVDCWERLSQAERVLKDGRQGK